LDLKDIKELIALMRKNDLSVFKMERDGFKITLKRGNDYQPIIAAPAPVPQNSIPVAAPVAPAPQSGVAAGDASEPKDNYKEIKSPMVGTFYAAPTPESPPYLSVGSTVTEGTVVCIIEAMKVMNEIKAEVSGSVVEVCAENGKPVQFEQVLFRVK
jgi:acetyl-CoA carboxylase biotin carboxyl carrier protein